MDGTFNEWVINCHQGLSDRLTHLPLPSLSGAVVTQPGSLEGAVSGNRSAEYTMWSPSRAETQERMHNFISLRDNVRK